jgi:hypothetical protein
MDPKTYGDATAAFNPVNFFQIPAQPAAAK